MGNVILVGMPASGKTSVGASVAAALGWTFVDLDEAIARDAGQSVADLLRREGETTFRVREAEALDRALTGQRQVIATGAGAPCFHDGMTRMRAANSANETAQVLWLDAPVDALVPRTLQDGDRPLLGHTRLEQNVALRDLASRRNATYARAHRRVDATPPLPAVVRQVLAALRPAVTSTIAFEDTQHPLILDEGLPCDAADALAALAGTGKIALIVDRKVRPQAEALETMLTARGVKTVLLDVPGGEKSKDLRTVAKLWQDLALHQLDRSDLLVALGGGATTDVAGFVAATWLRGVRHVGMPTTVLAMADASVGGKTAIDLTAGKNLVGAFHPPVLVWLALGALETLPGVEWRSGMAEIAKIFLALDADAWQALLNDAKALRRRSVAALRPHLQRAILLKAEIVARDPRELGDRALLNLGHTLGHALEVDSGYSLRHGDAVALGMIAAAEVSVAHQTAPADLPGKLRAGFAALDLPTQWEALATPAVLARLAQDKKVRGEMLRFVELAAIGRATVQPCRVTELESLLTALAAHAQRPTARVGGMRR
jgi:shikimate kinase/3-dehydroquinate synthase